MPASRDAELLPAALGNGAHQQEDLQSLFRSGMTTTGAKAGTAPLRQYASGSAWGSSACLHWLESGQMPDSRGHLVVAASLTTCYYKDFAAPHKQHIHAYTVN